MGVDWHKNIPLDKLNTFNVKARAQHFLEIKDLVEIKKQIKKGLFNQSLKPFILGGGSNILLVSPKIPFVILNKIKGVHLIKETSRQVIIRVMSGVNWHKWVEYSVKQQWSGIENLVAIPGTVGAAPIQNIGAYGVECQETILKIEGYHYELKKWLSISNKEAQFGYRDSIFKNELKNKFLITSVVFALHKKTKLTLNYPEVTEYLIRNNISSPAPKQILEAIKTIRQKKLPNPKILGNAGSFFKNPIVSAQKYNQLIQNLPQLKAFIMPNGLYKLSAAQIIDICGGKMLKNQRVNCYKTQPLIICNKGKASGKEILNFSNQIIELVSNKTGLILSLEVNII